MSSHRVVALVSPPQSTFELGCAAEVFGLQRPGLALHYEFGVCAETPGQIPTMAGYAMTVPDGLAALDSADTILIPGWKSHEASAEVVAALLRAHQRGCRIVAICCGAYALAQTGLLDGRTATAHWAETDDLAQRFPRVDFDPDVLYVDHGDIATSAGTAAGIDLCLHLVRTDHGAAYSTQVARRMVMPPHREGGQLQYAIPTTNGQPTDSLITVMEWAVERLAEPLTVVEMAAYAGVSTRTLARRFTDHLGVGPGKWVLAQRITKAQALLEETDLSVDAIAARVGLSSATNLRRRFHHSLRTTPAAYRRAFRQQSKHDVPRMDVSQVA